MHATLLTAWLVLAGGPSGQVSAPATTVAAAWARLPATGSACGEALGFDYGVEGGMRNFYCRALQVFTWKRLLALAPVAPFKRGPHQDGALDLGSSTDFGRYDPAFVRWASRALVPAAEDPVLREKTQAIYDGQVAALARTYYEVWRVLAAAPGWLRREREGYLAAMKSGDTSWSSGFMDVYHDTLGDADHGWGGHDPNLVRSATAFWVRRSIDETAELWFEGLNRLLATYDKAWLDHQRGLRPRPPPARKPSGALKD